MAARVLLAIPHDILRRGLQVLLLREPEVESVVPASNGIEALHIIKQEGVDVVVLGDDLPGLSRLGVIGRTIRRHPGIRCIALAEAPSRLELEQTMREGAAGIVTTQNPASMLVEAISTILQRGCYVSPDVTSAMIAVAAARDGQRPGALALTPREREVLRLVAEEYSNREIAAKLGISIRTVDTHRMRLMGKLGLRKTAELVRFAVREGLVAA